MGTALPEPHVPADHGLSLVAPELLASVQARLARALVDAAEQDAPAERAPNAGPAAYGGAIAQFVTSDARRFNKQRQQWLRELETWASAEAAHAMARQAVSPLHLTATNTGGATAQDAKITIRVGTADGRLHTLAEHRKTERPDPPRVGGLSLFAVSVTRPVTTPRVGATPRWDVTVDRLTASTRVDQIRHGNEPLALPPGLLVLGPDNLPVRRGFRITWKVTAVEPPVEQTGHLDVRLAVT